MKKNLALILLCFSNALFAATPNEKSILNFELGMSPEQVESQISKTYPSCKIKKLFYKDWENGGFSSIIGQISIDFFNDDNCQANQDADVRDNVSVSFSHPDFDTKQQAYEIRIFRSYAEPKALIKYSLNEVKKSLIQKYGSAPAESMKKNNMLIMPIEINSKGKSVRPKNTAFDVKLVWGENVQDVEKTCFDLVCGRYYLKADMLVDKNKNFYPKNTFYVKSIHFEMVDAELHSKHIGWIIDNEHKQDKKNLTF